MIPVRQNHYFGSWFRNLHGLDIHRVIWNHGEWRVPIRGWPMSLISEWSDFQVKRTNRISIAPYSPSMILDLSWEWYQYVPYWVAFHLYTCLAPGRMPHCERPDTPSDQGVFNCLEVELSVALERKRLTRSHESELMYWTACCWSLLSATSQ